MTIEDTLTNVEIFSELPQRDLARLAKVTRQRDFARGAVIVREGELGVAFYVVASGRVEVVKDLGKPSEKLLARFGPHDFFGEMALFDNQVRSSSVRAAEDTTCYVLTKWDFNAELMGANSRVATSLLAILARRIRQLNDVANH